MRKKIRYLFYKRIIRFKTEQEADEYAERLRKLGYKAQVLPKGRRFARERFTVQCYI